MAMNETEFNTRAETTLSEIESALESSAVECDFERKGDGVLELEFDDGSKIIVNRHGPAQEIWVAAKTGGLHFHFDGECWVNTRGGDELFAALSKLVSLQSGQPVILRPRT